MESSFLRKYAVMIAVGLLLFACWRFVLPIALPFGLGTLLAFAAEPLVHLLRKHMPRGAATGIGVSAALLGMLGILVVLTALLVRQLGLLTVHVPQLIHSANEGLDSLRTTLSDLSHRAPQSIRPFLQSTVDEAFSSSGTVVESFLQRLPAAAGAVLSYVTNSALTVGTACLAAYMISVRLPMLRHRLTAPDTPTGKLMPRLKRIRTALWGWLKAQCKLSAICFLILLTGFLLLGIPYAPLWAMLVALVDAVPLLGTGTVLIPWALVCLLQREGLRALGLLVIYAVALFSRTVMEPRLIGQQLGLDPLVTLASLYAGFYFWGVGGMLVAPILCVVIKETTAPKEI